MLRTMHIPSPVPSVGGSGGLGGAWEPTCHRAPHSDFYTLFGIREEKPGEREAAASRVLGPRPLCSAEKPVWPGSPSLVGPRPGWVTVPSWSLLVSLSLFLAGVAPWPALPGADGPAADEGG